MNELVVVDSVVMKLDIARTALAEAKTIQETKSVLDIAVAIEVYAKRQKLGEEAVQYATSIKVEALAQLGRMLRETPRNVGAKGIGTSAVPKEDYTPPTLSDMGLDKKTSKLAQDIASLPEDKIEAVKKGVVSITQARREQRRDESIKEVMDFPTSKYRVLYADPPWSYGDKLTENYGTAEYHYPTMSISELCVYRD